MNMEIEERANLERDILGSLLREPSLIKAVTLDAEHFELAAHRDIYNTLYILNGTANSLFEVLDHLQELYPETNATFDYIFNLESNVATTAHLPHHADLLKKKHYTDCVKQSSNKLLDEFTVENRLKLQNDLQRLERLGVNTDLGSLDETRDEVIYGLYNDRDEGIKTYTVFDVLFGNGMPPGMLFTIAARPSVGKSAFAVTNLVMTALERNKDLVADVFTMEMSKAETMIRYASLKTKLPSGHIKRGNARLNDKQKKMVAETVDYINHFNLNVYDNVSELEPLIAIIRRRAVEAKGKKHLVVIDYLGLMKTRERHNNRVLELSHITRELKVLASELGVTIVMLSQLNRGVEGRDDKEPMLSDLRDTGSTEQDSNAVAFLYYEDDNERNKDIRNVQLSLKKNREGPLRKTQFKFYAKEMRFEEDY